MASESASIASEPPTFSSIPSEIRMKILAFAMHSKYYVDTPQPPYLLAYNRFPEFPVLQGATCGLEIATEAREAFFKTRIFELRYEDSPSRLSIPRGPAMKDAAR